MTDEEAQDIFHKCRAHGLPGPEVIRKEHEHQYWLRWNDNHLRYSCIIYNSALHFIRAMWTERDLGGIAYSGRTGPSAEEKLKELGDVRKLPLFKGAE